MRSFILSPQIDLPDWVSDFLNANTTVPADREERVRFTVQLACENVRNQTGGPFAAAVFERETGRLFSVGLNRVVPAGQSYAHAEMTAVASAQYIASTHDLRPLNLELVSSCEPCAMCFGAIPWSGVASFVYGAPRDLPESIGFDEGDKVADWHDSYRRRGIEVFGPLLDREITGEPFRLYKKLVGEIY